jgi:hypothetical protein
MQQFLAILGSFGFVALGVALLRYTDAPPVVGWATIGFFGLGGIWMIVMQVYNLVTRKRRLEFVDVDLPLTELTQNAAGEYQVTAQGKLDGHLVGFSVLVGVQWDVQPGTGYTLYSGIVTLRAIGAVSDAFVGCLASRYRVSLATPRMLPEVVVQAVGLDSDPREIGLRPVKMKLFFQPESEDRYAEMFLNIDRTQQQVQIHEKDMDYRINIIRALAEAPS